MKWAARVLGAGTAASLLVLSSGARAEYEAACFGVENFGSEADGLCCEGCSDLEHAVDDAEHVHDMLAHYWYDQHEISRNLAVDPQDWADGSLMYPWGRDYVDPTGTDFADVIFYSGHGGYVCDSIQHTSWIFMGQHHSGQPCRLGPGDIYLGNSNQDANVLILAACHSMQLCVFQNYGYTWYLGGGQFNVINGFHGHSVDNADNTNRYADYVEAALYGGLGDDWVDYATDLAPVQWYSDQCGTTLVRADSESEANDQFNHGGFLDFHGTGTYQYQFYYSWCGGCDPDGGEALPEC